jgi:hypothetical protein
LKIFSLALKKNSEKSKTEEFWDNKIDVLSLFFMVVKSNFERLKFDSENFEIFFEIVSSLKLKYWTSDCLGAVYNSVLGFLVDVWKLGENPKIAEIENFLLHSVNRGLNDGKIKQEIFEIFFQKFKEKNFSKKNFDLFLLRLFKEGSEEYSQLRQRALEDKEILQNENFIKILKVQNSSKIEQ